MLTLEHVHLRRHKAADGTRCVAVVPRCGLERGRALELAALAADIARTHVGESRAALEEALDDVVASADDAREARFARGLKKLTLDACAFDVESPVSPEVLRGAVFREAARARAAGTFHRAAVLEAVAAQHALAAADVEEHLHADLAPAHAVRTVEVGSGEELLERAALGELQAVLLRASRLTMEVAGTPQELRAVLRALKLHQLLFDVEPRSDSLRLVVEGPMGLFQQSTRYGLKLALVLPAVLACGSARLEVSARLRKQGAPEVVVIGGRPEGLPPFTSPEPSAVVRELYADLEAAGPPWRPRPALDVIRLPGAAAAMVPDLELVHDETGDVVAVEVLGFWSRAAVWRRVELVEQGLPVRAVFCVSDRLRVSEEALPDDAAGALVVFKGSLRAARVREAAERVTRAQSRKGAARAGDHPATDA